jgi:hypothetical protein
MQIEQIKKKYKFIIIYHETNEINLVKSTRLISTKLKEKNIIISHMFFYRYFKENDNFIKDNFIIKKLNW